MSYKGKAIYNPSGKAGEYSYWACNFYVGCSNGCEYCYCKKGVLASTMGGDKPTLKKCFKDEQHALQVFGKELKANLQELQKHGLFFSFTTDPMLPETNKLTRLAIRKCLCAKVPVKILTKCAWWIDEFLKGPDYFISGWSDWMIEDKIIFEKLAFGFTLTGHDELEKGASSNAERIAAMKKLHEAGFKTFASIEPIIDFDASMKMIQSTLGFCYLYKVGLESGKRYFKRDLEQFVHHVSWLLDDTVICVYWKDSITKVIGPVDRVSSVTRDYNIFKVEEAAV